MDKDSRDSSIPLHHGDRFVCLPCFRLDDDFIAPVVGDQDHRLDGLIFPDNTAVTMATKAPKTKIQMFRQLDHFSSLTIGHIFLNFYGNWLIKIQFVPPLLFP